MVSPSRIPGQENLGAGAPTPPSGPRWCVKSRCCQSLRPHEGAGGSPYVISPELPSRLPSGDMAAGCPASQLPPQRPERTELPSAFSPIKEGRLPQSPPGGFPQAYWPEPGHMAPQHPPSRGEHPPGIARSWTPTLQASFRGRHLACREPCRGRRPTPESRARPRSQPGEGMAKGKR